jgi:mono/diheme cytochrome c family protein
MRGVQLLALLFVLALVVAACGDSAATTTTTAAPEATTATTQPPATTEPPATTQAPTTTTVEVVPTDTEAITTTSAISDEQLAAAAAVGDIAAGEELYNTRVLLRLACSSCHLLEDGSSPTHAGLSAAAADRVDGMSAVDYLRQSIVDPGAFLVGGEWANPMPPQFSDVLSEDQINNLIAFLLTQ